MVDLARDRVHLPGECGINQLWMTSFAGAVIVEVDEAADRQSQLVHGDGAVRVDVAPVELPPFDSTVRCSPAAVAVGDVVDPAELVEDEAR